MKSTNIFKTDILNIECALDNEPTDIEVTYQMEQTLGMESPVGIPTSIRCQKSRRLGCTTTNCLAWNYFG